MAQGIQAFNNDAELTFSAEGWGFHYLGQATFGSTVASPTTGDGTAGYSTYTYTHSGTHIMVGTLLSDSIYTSVGIRSITKSGSTWTIRIQRAGGTAYSNGFYNETNPTVFVWGTPSTSTNFGAAIYDSSGNLRADLSKYPYSWAARASFTAGSTSVAMSGSFESVAGTIYPILVSGPVGSGYGNTGNGGFGNYTELNYRTRFYRSGTTLYRGNVLETRQTFFEDSPIAATGTTNDYPAQTCFLIDGYRIVSI